MDLGVQSLYCIYFSNLLFFFPPDDRNLLDFEAVVAYQIKTGLLLKKNNEII